MADYDARRLLLEIAGLGDEEHGDESEVLASAVVKVYTVTFV